MGQLTGKPSTSTLHIHPVLNDDRELGGTDKEISTISSKQFNKFYRDTQYSLSNKNQTSAKWHSDIPFEPVPADYTSLRLTELPKTGGGAPPAAISAASKQSKSAEANADHT